MVGPAMWTLWWAVDGTIVSWVMPGAAPSRGVDLCHPVGHDRDDEFEGVDCGGAASGRFLVGPAVMALTESAQLCSLEVLTWQRGQRSG